MIAQRKIYLNMAQSSATVFVTFKMILFVLFPYFTKFWYFYILDVKYDKFIFYQ